MVPCVCFINTYVQRMYVRTNIFETSKFKSKKFITVNRFSVSVKRKKIEILDETYSLSVTKISTKRHTEALPSIS